jgi:hypothetical protein
MQQQSNGMAGSTHAGSTQKASLGNRIWKMSVFAFPLNERPNQILSPASVGLCGLDIRFLTKQRFPFLPSVFSHA